MTAPAPDTAELAKQVADTERAFAKTMAGPRLRGVHVVPVAGGDLLRRRQGAARQAGSGRCLEALLRQARAAPFSWRPETVEVLDSGTLALSSGPVFDPSGKQFATFTSIWRLEAPGVWRIVFDKGNDVCDCAKAP